MDRGVRALANTAETMVQPETVFYSHIPDKPCIQSSNFPVRYTNLPAHTFLQQYYLVAEYICDTMTFKIVWMKTNII